MQMFLYIISLRVWVVSHMYFKVIKGRQDFQMIIRLFISMFLVLFAVGSVQARQHGFDPTVSYSREYIEGFTIYINAKVLSHKKEHQELRQALRSQLIKIKRTVPVIPLTYIKTIKVWVEWNSRKSGLAEFHYSTEWLKNNGYNPEKAGHVEISNTVNFIQQSKKEQPSILLHEFSHGYEYFRLKGKHEKINAAYRNAVQKGLYQRVKHVSGKIKNAYALKNKAEYFAELTEACLGRNDYYPFDKDQLKKYDPVGYQLMLDVWGKC